MLISEIKRVIEQVSRDKGIERHVLIKALEEALKSAARKKYGPKVDIEVQYSEETGELEVFQFKEVTEAVEEPMLQISIEEGRRLVLRPCIPDEWPGFRVDLRLPGGDAHYAIHVRNPGGTAARVVAVALDGQPLPPSDGAAICPITPGPHHLDVAVGA